MSMILSAQVADYVLMAKCLAKAGGRLSLAAQYADQSSNGLRVATVLRSAMSAGSVADAGWAGNLVGHRRQCRVNQSRAPSECRCTWRIHE